MWCLLEPTGVQQGGVEGLLRGLGRGILGLITRPALGVLDAVATAADGVRRAVDLGHDVSGHLCCVGRGMVASSL